MRICEFGWARQDSLTDFSVPEISQGPNNTAEAEEYRKANLAAVHAETQFSSQILRCCQALLRERRPVLYDNAELTIHCGHRYASILGFLVPTYIHKWETNPMKIIEATQHVKEFNVIVQFRVGFALLDTVLGLRFYCATRKSS